MDVTEYISPGRLSKYPKLAALAESIHSKYIDFAFDKSEDEQAAIVEEEADPDATMEKPNDHSSDHSSE